MSSNKPWVVVAGNSLEFYDFVLYGFVAPIFSPLFFPVDQYGLSLLYAYALFAIGFIFRPVGVIIWGHIADKHGRKPVLILTISMMVIPALGIAILPTYESIGVTAPILLLILRILQGVSYSGEMPSALSVIYESSPQSKKIFHSSFMEISAILGTILAALVVALITFLLSENQLNTWGWRLPFIVSIFGIIILAYIRMSLTETLLQNKKFKYPVFSALKNQWRSVVLIALLIAPNCLCFYAYVAYMPNIYREYAEYTMFGSLILSALSFIYILLIIPVISVFALAKNVKRTLLVSLIGMPVFTFLIYSAIAYKLGFTLLLLGILGTGLFLAILYAVHLPLIAAQSKTELRVSTIGLGVNISVTLFGGTAPMINEYLQSAFDSILAPSVYFALICFVAIFAVYKMKSIDNFS